MKIISYSTICLAAALLLASMASAAGTPYEAVAVTDGGTISGKVTWSGAAPTIESLVVNKNVESCDPAGIGTRKSPRLVISPSGGISNAVVYIEEIAKGKKMETGDLVIDQIGCTYTPHITIAPKKSKITLKSSDDILHNIHMFGAANYNIPFPDMNSVLKSFRKAGVARFQCDAGHGWMSAYVHVVTHPYYALTDAEGNYSLTEVPPGKYTLKMWHESWEVVNRTEKDGEITGYEFAEPVEQSQDVEVASGAESKVVFSLSGD